MAASLSWFAQQLTKAYTQKFGGNTAQLLAQNKLFHLFVLRPKVHDLYKHVLKVAALPRGASILSSNWYAEQHLCESFLIVRVVFQWRLVCLGYLQRHSWGVVC